MDPCLAGDAAWRRFSAARVPLPGTIGVLYLIPYSQIETNIKKKDCDYVVTFAGFVAIPAGNFLVCFFFFRR